MQEAVLADIDNQIESQELKVRRKEGEIEELRKKIATLEQRDTSAQVRATVADPIEYAEYPLPPLL
jgi:hypothetical protein